MSYSNAFALLAEEEEKPKKAAPKPAKSAAPAKKAPAKPAAPAKKPIGSATAEPKEKEVQAKRIESDKKDKEKRQKERNANPKNVEPTSSTENTKRDKTFDRTKGKKDSKKGGAGGGNWGATTTAALTKEALEQTEQTTPAEVVEEVKVKTEDPERAAARAEAEKLAAAEREAESKLLTLKDFQKKNNKIKASKLPTLPEARKVEVPELGQFKSANVEQKKATKENHKEVSNKPKVNPNAGRKIAEEMFKMAQPVEQRERRPRRDRPEGERRERPEGERRERPEGERRERPEGERRERRESATDSKSEAKTDAKSDAPRIERPKRERPLDGDSKSAVSERPARRGTGEHAGRGRGGASRGRRGSSFNLSEKDFPALKA